MNQYGIVVRAHKVRRIFSAKFCRNSLSVAIRSEIKAILLANSNEFNMIRNNLYD